MPRHYAGLGLSRVCTRMGSFDSSARPMGVASQNDMIATNGREIVSLVTCLRVRDVIFGYDAIRLVVQTTVTTI